MYCDAEDAAVACVVAAEGVRAWPTEAENVLAAGGAGVGEEAGGGWLKSTLGMRKAANVIVRGGGDAWAARRGDEKLVWNEGVVAGAGAGAKVDSSGRGLTAVSGW